MADYIDCRVRDGKECFRIFSSVVDAYVTNVMDAEQLRRMLQQGSLEDALRTYLRETDGRIERARAQGTSQYGVYGMPTTPAEKVLKGPWRNNDKPEADGVVDLQGMYFMVSGNSPLGEVSDVSGAKTVQHLLSREPELKKSFEDWAELSAFGEVLVLGSLHIVRVLAKK